MQVEKKEETFNQLTLFALLYDTVTFIKFKQHLAPNWKTAKDKLCRMSGQSTNISAVKLLNLIGVVCEDNGEETYNKFWNYIERSKVTHLINTK